MKKRILSLAVLALTVMTSSAQTYVVFHLNDSTTRQFKIADVDSLMFTGLDPAALNGHEYVDMGLSVNWAPVNVDLKKENNEAASPESWGTYAGWGDPTGEMSSDYNDDYLGKYPPNNICSSEYDIAHVNWGGTWRLPTFEEFKEFTDTYSYCTRTWTTRNSYHGYEITGPSGNSIFLPASGFYFSIYSTSTKAADEDVDGGYWTGQSFIASDLKGRARYLFFLKDYFDVVFDVRSYRQSIRPCIQKEAMIRHDQDRCDFIPLDRVVRITFE